MWGRGLVGGAGRGFIGGEGSGSGGKGTGGAGQSDRQALDGRSEGATWAVERMGAEHNGRRWG